MRLFPGISNVSLESNRPSAPPWSQTPAYSRVPSHIATGIKHIPASGAILLPVSNTVESGVVGESKTTVGRPQPLVLPPTSDGLGAPNCRKNAIVDVLYRDTGLLQHPEHPTKRDLEVSSLGDHKLRHSQFALARYTELSEAKIGLRTSNSGSPADRKQQDAISICARVSPLEKACRHIRRHCGRAFCCRRTSLKQFKDVKRFHIAPSNFDSPFIVHRNLPRGLAAAFDWRFPT